MSTVLHAQLAASAHRLAVALVCVVLAACDGRVLPAADNVRDLPDTGIVTPHPKGLDAGDFQPYLDGGLGFDGGHNDIGVMPPADALAAETTAEVSPPRERVLPLQELGLPILRLEPSPAINPDSYTPALLITGGHAYTAAAKMRGTSSIEYPKKNFTIKFSPSDPLLVAHDNGQLHARRKLVLFSSFDDNSHLRTRLAFELWNRLQRGALRVHAESVILYVGDDFHGVYTAVDHIDEDFFADEGVGAGGQLFKAINHDASFFHTNDLFAAYEKKAGLPEEGSPGAFAAIENLTSFVVNASDADFGMNIGAIVDVPSYTSWFILANVIYANDSFGKNAYNYEAVDGRWWVVPWDFNASFGQDWATFRVPADLPYDIARPYNHLFQRLLADPDLGPSIRARFATSLNLDLPLQELLDLVDLWASRLRGAALRDAERWDTAYRGFARWADRGDFTDFDGEVEYLKAWMTARWSVIAAALADEGRD